MKNEHQITVELFNRTCPIRKERFRFVLCDRGVICGSRLESPGPEKGQKPWPFKDGNWMFHNDRKEADKAAKKLQSYLDSSPLIIPEHRPNR